MTLMDDMARYRYVILRVCARADMVSVTRC